MWRMGGNSSLHLTTSSGNVNVGFNLQLGHPDTPFPSHTSPPFPPSYPSPPPHSSPPPRPRHRGPAQREKNCLRAARHQAALRQTPLAGPPLTQTTPSTVPGTSLSSPVTAPVVTSPTMTVSPSVPNVSAAVPVATPLVPVVTEPVLMNTPSAASVETVKSSSMFKCEHCDFYNESETNITDHVESTHKKLTCNHCGIKITSINSMNTHIQSAHKKFTQPSSTYSLAMPPLNKQDFTFAHPPYEASFTKCLLRGIGCTGTAAKYFTSVKVVVNSQTVNQKHIYTCQSCLKYIPIEEQNSKPSCPVG